MPQDLNHPAWAVSIGMVLYAHRTRTTRAAESNNSSLRDKFRAMFASSF
jgi:cell division protein FtsA